LNKQLVEAYRRRSFARFMKNETNYELLVQLVVEDCLAIIEANKSPNKVAMINKIKQHFGLNHGTEV
jgi:hypothetical protein